MNDKEEKKPVWMWAAVILITVVVVNLISFFGYAVEMNSEKDNAPVLNLMNGFMAVSKGDVKFSPIQIIGAFFGGNGATRKAVILSFIGAALGILYFKNGNGKRYHKKGIEHGSAKWGDQKEKDMIADTTPDGFYNNVIVASDVFLVLDRKQRDKNEEKQKRGNAINKSSEENESKGQEDKAHAES